MKTNVWKNKVNLLQDWGSDKKGTFKWLTGVGSYSFPDMNNKGKIWTSENLVKKNLQKLKLFSGYGSEIAAEIVKYELKEVEE